MARIDVPANSDYPEGRWIEIRLPVYMREKSRIIELDGQMTAFYAIVNDRVASGGDTTTAGLIASLPDGQMQPFEIRLAQLELLRGATRGQSWDGPLEDISDDWLPGLLRQWIDATEEAVLPPASGISSPPE